MVKKKVSFLRIKDRKANALLRFRVLGINGAKLSCCGRFMASNLGARITRGVSKSDGFFVVKTKGLSKTQRTSGIVEKGLPERTLSKTVDFI